MKPDRDLKKLENAFLVATYTGSENRKVCEEHLEELELLGKTLGVRSVGKMAVSIKKINASTFINKGKIEELIEEISHKEANLLIFDDEITPAQQRNLEKIFKIPVIERTELILAVFAQRAHTKEAKLQVELAQLRYQYPRLKKMWTHLSRQVGTGGPGAYLKGTGEKQIEMDRRLVRKRIEHLKKQIEEVKSTRDTQRTARLRRGIPVFAIIGYTNAGKSTLLNALTEADVLVEDKLFATLDTTTRRYLLGNKQEILLIDTVGFIRKLPHALIAAFRSTLEEALQADILLHVVDVCHPLAEEQAETSYQVLQELNAENKPIITVLNKFDSCENRTMITRMRVKYPHTVVISAKTGYGFEDLRQEMHHQLRHYTQSATLRIPQKEFHLVSEVLRRGHILSQEYVDNDIIIQAELPKELYEMIKIYQIE
ncbi:MAG: GTPase HflX [Chlamydiales bacterium]